MDELDLFNCHGVVSLYFLRFSGIRNLFPVSDLSVFTLCVSQVCLICVLKWPVSGGMRKVFNFLDRKKKEKSLFRFGFSLGHTWAQLVLDILVIGAGPP